MGQSGGWKFDQERETQNSRLVIVVARTKAQLIEKGFEWVRTVVGLK